MSEYILTLCSISVFCGVIYILAPSGEGGSLKQNVRLVSALAVLCVAVFPLGSFLMQLGEYDFELALEDFEGADKGKYEAEFCAAMQEYSDDAVAEICEKTLVEKFGLDADDIKIVIFSCVENNNITIQRADLEIYFGAIAKPSDPMKECLEEMLGCECRIIYK